MLQCEMWLRLGCANTAPEWEVGTWITCHINLLNYIQNLQGSGVPLHCCFWLPSPTHLVKETKLSPRITTNLDFNFSKSCLDLELSGGSFYFKGTFLK